MSTNIISTLAFLTFKKLFRHDSLIWLTTLQNRTSTCLEPFTEQALKQGYLSSEQLANTVLSYFRI